MYVFKCQCVSVPIARFTMKSVDKTVNYDNAVDIYVHMHACVICVWFHTLTLEMGIYHHENANANEKNKVDARIYNKTLARRYRCSCIALY